MVTWEYLRIDVLGPEEVRIYPGFDKRPSMCQWLKEKLAATLQSEYLKEAKNLKDMKVDGASNYRRVRIPYVNIVDILNVLGSEGWGIVGIESRFATNFWMKRASGIQAVVSTNPARNAGARTCAPTSRSLRIRPHGSVHRPAKDAGWDRARS